MLAGPTSPFAPERSRGSQSAFEHQFSSPGLTRRGRHVGLKGIAHDDGTSGIWSCGLTIPVDRYDLLKEVTRRPI